jgi:RND family efflux transporter MFP subunit
MTQQSYDENYYSPPPKKKPSLMLILLIVVPVAVFLVLFLIGFIPRIFRQGELEKMHAETVGAVPIVRAITAREAKHTESITLPGNIGAIQYTTIYARVDGYLKSRLVDIGDAVKKGQLLAVIDTPTVDQELAQARADLLEAKAAYDNAIAQLKEDNAKVVTAEADVDKAKTNVQYATITAKRWQDMCVRGSVSQQSRDEKIRLLDAQTADLKAQRANYKAAQAQVEVGKAEVKQASSAILAKAAAVKRLEDEQGFQKVVAPFDGVITLRKVDPGALITKGSQSSNLELYQIAGIDALRIYISVPQRIARYMKPGMMANVNVPEYPERKFVGIVTNVSGALDPNTRTRQTEIKIDNPDHALLPGMYAEVQVTTVREEPWIRVPGTTLVTRPDGMFVIVVKDSKVHYQPITIGRDFGEEVEVKVGLKSGEQVVVSPSDDLREGEPVKTEAVPENET